MLRTHDRFGNRIDTVDFHPAYHSLMRLGQESFQLPTFSWVNTQRGAQVVCVCVCVYVCGERERDRDRDREQRQCVCDTGREVERKRVPKLA